MTQNTPNPDSLSAQAEKIRDDLMAALLKAVKAAPAAPATAAPPAPAEPPAPKAL